MPNKYEREIEEILRNLEHTEPKAGFGRKVSGRMRRRTSRSRWTMPVVRLNGVEWYLVIAIVAALFAGGWAYAHRAADLMTGIIAIVGFICVAIVALAPFITWPRYSTPTRQYNNVTPLHRKPFNRLGTSWHLLMLKLRYRRRRNQER